MNASERLVQRLLRIKPPLFAGIDPTLLNDWMAAADLQEQPSGAVVLSADQPNDNTLLVVSGGLQVSLQQEGKALLAHIGPGECVGEASSLTLEETSAWVHCIETSELLVIERATLLGWAQQSHQLALNLLQLLGDRLRSSNLHARGAQSLNQQLQTRALSDALTGALNRHWLDEHRITMQQSPELALLMVDIDHFKAINDNHGHSCGDAVLQAVARELRRSIRPSDALVRLGGEEFLVICRQEQNHETVIHLGERLRTAIQHLNSDDLPSVTVSVGIALRAPDETWEPLLTRADAALYRAKGSGRNRVELG